MEKIREKKSIIYVSAITSFITTFTGSALNLSIPAMEDEFNVSAGTVGWVITIYMLTCAALAVPFGRLGDRLERRRILTLGILIFSLSSAAAIFSPNMILFLVFRLVQGIGASMIFSTNIAILVGSFDKEDRGKVIGYTTCANYVGLSAGPVIGGILNYNLGWRWIFITTATVSSVAFFIALAKLPRNGKVQSEKKPKDITGNIFFVISMILLMYGISSFGQNNYYFYVLGAGALSAVFFIYTELKAAEPVINIRIFKENPAFGRMNIAAMINYGANFVMSYILSVYLQVIKGMTSQTAGIILSSNTVIMALLSPFVGKLSDKLSPSKISAAGMAVCTAALFIFSTLNDETSIVKTVLILALSGAGFALFSTPNTNAIMSSVKEDDYGVVSSLLATMRSMGHTSAMAVVTGIVGFYMGKESLSTASPDILVTVIHKVFIVFGSLCILGFFMAIRRKV